MSALFLGGAASERPITGDYVTYDLQRSPGLTCEDIAHAVGTATGRVKPFLTALTLSGHLRKEGRARGTRYLPA